MLVDEYRVEMRGPQETWEKGAAPGEERGEQGRN